MPVTFHLLTSGDAALLANVAPGVFDGPVDPAILDEFLSDPRHHIVVARENATVVAFASAFHYVHPDKRAQLWVNEVGTAPTHRGRGLAKELLRMLASHARELGCTGLWVATEGDNEPARALYRSMGWDETEGIALYETGFQESRGAGPDP